MEGNPRTFGLIPVLGARPPLTRAPMILICPLPLLLLGRLRLRLDILILLPGEKRDCELTLDLLGHFALVEDHLERAR